MSKNPWVVDPTDNVETVDLTFQDRPFWIKVKKVLNTGEEKRMQSAGFSRYIMPAPPGKEREIKDPSTHTGPMIDISWETTIFTKILTWLVDWSLADDDANKLPLTMASLRLLHRGLFKIIEEAVDAHAAAMEEQSKNSQTSPLSAVTSA